MVRLHTRGGIGHFAVFDIHARTVTAFLLASLAGSVGSTGNASLLTDLTLFAGVVESHVSVVGAHEGGAGCLCIPCDCTGMSKCEDGTLMTVTFSKMVSFDRDK